MLTSQQPAWRERATGEPRGGKSRQHAVPRAAGWKFSRKSSDPASALIQVGSQSEPTT